jgi:hypothetical protein
MAGCAACRGRTRPVRRPARTLPGHFKIDTWNFPCPPPEGKVRLDSDMPHQRKFLIHLLAFR